VTTKAAHKGSSCQRRLADGHIVLFDINSFSFRLWSLFKLAQVMSTMLSMTMLTKLCPKVICTGVTLCPLKIVLLWRRTHTVAENHTSKTEIKRTLEQMLVELFCDEWNCECGIFFFAGDVCQLKK
jgi:hypothetical protein